MPRHERGAGEDAQPPRLEAQHGERSRRWACSRRGRSRGRSRRARARARTCPTPSCGSRRRSARPRGTRRCTCRDCRSSSCTRCTACVGGASAWSASVRSRSSRRARRRPTPTAGAGSGSGAGPGGRRSRPSTTRSGGPSRRTRARPARVTTWRENVHSGSCRRPGRKRDDRSSSGSPDPRRRRGDAAFRRSRRADRQRARDLGARGTRRRGRRVRRRASRRPRPRPRAWSRREGGRAEVIVGDVADEAACAQIVDEAVRALGGLDGVVCNVGIGLGRGLEGTSVEEWDAVHAVNVRAHFLVVPRRAPGDGRRRRDRVHLVGRGLAARHAYPRVRHHEGRARGSEPPRRARRGAARHPGQRGRAGPDRHAARPARHRGPPEPGPHPGSRSAARAPRGRWRRRSCSC